MPWIEAEFTAEADANGEICNEERLSAPASGRLRNYKVKTTSGCRNRSHRTHLTITRVSDPADRIEINIEIGDCSDVEREIDPPYRFRSGEDYDVLLTAAGFDEGEHVEGTAGLYYTLFFKLNETKQGSCSAAHRPRRRRPHQLGQMETEMDDYQLGKDIQEIKDRLNLIENATASRQPNGTRGERMRLNLSNHALLDLWVVWSNDVHQGPHTDFMPNGSTQERKSRKVDVLDGAFFTIEVFKNAGGSPGHKIGHFTDNVYGYDHVEFLVVDVGGQQYFKAVSLVTVGKVLLYVLL